MFFQLRIKRIERIIRICLRPSGAGFPSEGHRNKKTTIVKKNCNLLILALLMLAGCNGRQSDNAVALTGFPTLQQSTDYTCGCASAQMVMRYYRADAESEEALAAKMHTHVDSRTPDAQPGSAVMLTDYGTSVKEIYRYFDSREDFEIVASSYRPDVAPALLDDTARVGIQAIGNAAPQFAGYDEAARFFRRQLEEGHPVMVCWNLWGGHWTVCIGYDDRGTADTYDDDLLTMADPYDQTDGRTDGITQVSLVAFFYDWFCTMTPKPWQLQPYIVVAPK